jgi:hypothetical protein
VSGGDGMNMRCVWINWVLGQPLNLPLLYRGRRLGSPEVSTGITASTRKHISKPSQNFALQGRMKCHLNDGNVMGLMLQVKKVSVLVPQE